jgi:Bacterial dnaA protein helix-turn-helix
MVSARLSTQSEPASGVTRGNQNSPAPLHVYWCDPVRAQRLRQTLERFVVLGVAPGHCAQRSGSLQLALPWHRGRGGTRIVYARQLAIYLAHVACGLNYADAGRIYNRDRTTAAHACAVIEHRRENPALDQLLGLLELCVRAEFARIEPVLAARIRYRVENPAGLGG